MYKLLTLLFLFVSCLPTQTEYNHMILLMEKYYMEGQKDALETKERELPVSKYYTKRTEEMYNNGYKDVIDNSIIIKKVSNKYVWTHTLWDNGDWPIYSEE